MNNQESTTKFIQIHFLTSYPASLLNRDDIGFAKRMPFGSGTRIRISSQCLKRHWRSHEGIHSLKNLAIEPSIRSRKIISEKIFDPLYQEFGLKKALKATNWLKDLVLGKSKKNAQEEKKKNAKSKNEEEFTYETAKKSTELDQIIVLGKPEIDYLHKIGKEHCLMQENNDGSEKELEKKLKANLQALGKSGQGAEGLDAALFGRMVTADFLARSDAAIHVAHAFTVHNERSEPDYFTAVDDLESLGSAHINTTELNSGLFYGYIVVDLPLLVSNLTGCDRADWTKQDKSLSAQVVETLIRIVATVSPGAKKGSTAPYAYSHFILIEAGDAQPCSLANAFLESLKPGEKLMNDAVSKLKDFMSSLDGMYEFDNKRCFASMVDCQGMDKVNNCIPAKNLTEVVEWTGRHIRGEIDE